MVRRDCIKDFKLKSDGRKRNGRMEEREMRR